MNEFFLQVISGNQVGKKMKVTGEITLGRAGESTLCFSGPDGTLVSSMHASIAPEGDNLILTDMGSRNGTFVNGERIDRVALKFNDIVSLGQNGPKFRVLGNMPVTETLVRGRDIPAAFPPPENRPRNKSKPDFSNPPNSSLGDAGNYTIGLAHRFKNDEVDHQEVHDLLKDKKRAARLVQSGVLGQKDARMIQSASMAYSSSRKKGLTITLSITGVALIIVSLLAYQNMGYRGKLKKQEHLVTDIHELENELAREQAVRPTLDGASGETDEERAQLVAKLRAAERQLMSVRSNLNSKDLINTYKNPLGREIHTILQGFGKENYIVPDIFISQVEKHIYTFTKTGTRRIIESAFANKSKYETIIENELTKQGMPIAFLYLAMHESCLNPVIVSKAGARGIWQFMPQTGRDYGLRVPENWQNLPPEEDQRTDPVLSTASGVKYLKTLYAEFGDVALAMAAYNAGEGTIRKALRRIDDPVNNRDFWYIYRMGSLAAETNEYVPKIIATMIIDKNRARYGLSP